ncbi:MAG: 2-oxoacid:acceptor oxidoreductase subunit alpha [Ignavibacteria bacterium]|nr:2-oxoacid:acceptor oxidoreductase subunit alpha [Ignavibacteria bacterium]MBT8383503.1 2-oxoacid:acceptor oxidoreductase subunit alpha [Ignavibacteria bacterium]NNJ53763.1 2-oxoacid:acceptor oxidoreductase subunit alpha [Ignavibacteriaceae bacterium]NNL19816.1 2-oxoacid:acceptor oxidoreductase subunit alpha [Ignavibacteriaceae bacterium]
MLIIAETKRVLKNFMHTHPEMGTLEMEGNQNHSETDFAIRIGGEGGEGVISAGELFAQVAARTAYQVFTYITYPAEIKGGFSMIQIRIKHEKIYSMGSTVDYLIAFNQQAYDVTIKDLKPGGTLIYDPDEVEIKEDLNAECYPIKLTKLVVDATGAKLGKNVVALGALGHLFGVEFGVLEKLIKDRYGAKGGDVIKNNLNALKAGYFTAEEGNWEKKFKLVSDTQAKEHYMLISGNEAVALGAIAAGCRFVAGYPITPATPIFETLTDLMPKVGGRAIQLEDEIASLSACIGASFAGEKAITPTSGPGLQLMGEQLNLASMLELPLVIVDVQRGGPSTGLPTKTEQSDLKFAIYGTSGEAPRVILAPSSVEDCFYQTIRAFNISERLQMPVVVLTDQSIGYRKATVRMPDLSKIIEVDNSVSGETISIPSPEKIELASRIQMDPEKLNEYKRFLDTATGVSPITSPGLKGGQYLGGGLEHDETGKASYLPDNHLKMMRKRFKKLETLTHILEKNPPEYEGPEEAKIGVIGWGSTEGAIREARMLAEQRGILFRHLHPKILSPLPESQVRNFLAGLKQVIIVEENFTGQFAHFVKAKFGIKPIEIHKSEGVPITPEEIFTGIEKVARIVDEKNIARL